MTVRSHDIPDKNLIGSIPIGTLQTGIEHGTRRWNMTMKGHFCDGEGHKKSDKILVLIVVP